MFFVSPSSPHTHLPFPTSSSPYLSRETDGAASYNSVFVALVTLQMESETGIKVTAHSHNEGGHGSDICDTAGANCIRQCWRYSVKTGLSIVCAKATTHALQLASMDGFIHRRVSHDPDWKITLARGVSFTHVGTKSMLYKEYPVNGTYEGGIVFRRYYGIGTGNGLG